MMRICCVLACDANFFHQLQAAIATITAARPTLGSVALDIAVVGIDLHAHQIATLKADGIIVHEDVERFPLFPGAPRHTYALTCRPFIPEFLPGYDGYMWIDSDIRFLQPQGLQYYVAALHVAGASVVIVQETEPCYSVNVDPKIAHLYHSAFFNRLNAVHGGEVAEYFRHFTQCNAGLFAARADSPLWTRYRRNVVKATRVPFDNMLEQDAMNVSLFEVGNQIRAPSSMNWLCSLAMPARRDDGAWCNPENPAETICVAHLTNSSSPVHNQPGISNYYQLYQRIGLTA